MIKARRLFLAPVLAILLTSWWPIMGIPVCIMLIAIWYIKKQSQIHSYFKGINYEQDELSKEEREKDKFL